MLHSGLCYVLSRTSSKAREETVGFDWKHQVDHRQIQQLCGSGYSSFQVVGGLEFMLMHVRGAP